MDTKNTSILSMFLSMWLSVKFLELVFPSLGLVLIQLLICCFAYLILSRKTYLIYSFIRIFFALPSNIVSSQKAIMEIESRILLIRLGANQAVNYLILKEDFFDPVPSRFEYHTLLLQKTVEDVFIEVSPTINSAKFLIWAMIPIAIMLEYYIIPKIAKPSLNKYMNSFNSIKQH